MSFRFRVLTLAGVCALAAVVSPAPGVVRAQDGTPTMTDSTFAPEPAPLPEDWPGRVGDAQFRGAACESAYGRDGAKQLGDPGDDVLPIVGTMTSNAGSAMRAVRHVAFLTRRDVERATLVSSKDDPTIFEVDLTLTPDGQAKAKEFTTANTGKCISLVAGGKVLWTATLDGPVEDNTFVLSGSFSGRQGMAIVDLFEQ